MLESARSLETSGWGADPELSHEPGNDAKERRVGEEAGADEVIEVRSAPFGAQAAK